MGTQTPRRSEVEADSIRWIGWAWERDLRMWQKRQRCADQSNYSCANQAGPGGGTGISAARAHMPTMKPPAMMLEINAGW